jgi:hypothetical protein
MGQCLVLPVPAVTFDLRNFGIIPTYTVTYFIGMLGQF